MRDRTLYLGDAERLEGLHRLDLIEPHPAVQRGVRIPSRDNYDLSIGKSGDATEFARQARGMIETGK